MRTQPNLPFYGLDVVAKFPLLTRAAFAAKYGVEPPVFDYGKPIKRWRDDDANPASGREFMLYKVATLSGGGMMVPDKSGFVEPVDTGMSAAEAYAVNIPPDLGTVPGTTTITEARMPIELLPNERLFSRRFASLEVKRLDIPDVPAATSGGFTESDRTALYTCVNLLKDLKAGK